MNESAESVRLIHILSTSYSGKTWFSLMLGSHPEAFTVGKLSKALSESDSADCVLHGTSCPFWSQIDFTSNENPYLQIARLSGRSVLVVNNTREGRKYQSDPRVQTHYVHLLRDGRAVTASMLRKSEHAGMWEAARRWRNRAHRHLKLLRRERDVPQDHVHYEHVLADPAGVMRRLCERIGIDWDAGMLEYWRREHHYLGGHKGTLLAMTRKQGGDEQPVLEAAARPDGPQWDLDYYRQSDPAQFDGQRWKRELSRRQLWMFQLAAGRMNRRLGYGANGALLTRADA